MIDSNIILDIATEDPQWFNWSSEVLAKLADTNTLVINPIIFAEVSIGFEKIEDVETLLLKNYFLRESIPWEASFLAGKCFVAYRKRGGSKTNPLPDFFIGAHAAVRDYQLLTRDVARYETYFPKLKLISPKHCLKKS